MHLLTINPPKKIHDRVETKKKQYSLYPFMTRVHLHSVLYHFVFNIHFLLSTCYTAPTCTYICKYMYYRLRSTYEEEHAVFSQNV